jgi:hypothetical protein
LVLEGTVKDFLCLCEHLFLDERKEINNLIGKSDSLINGLFLEPFIENGNHFLDLLTEIMLPFGHFNV